MGDLGFILTGQKCQRSKSPRTPFRDPVPIVGGIGCYRQLPNGAHGSLPSVTGTYWEQSDAVEPGGTSCDIKAAKAGESVFGDIMCRG